MIATYNFDDVDIATVLYGRSPGGSLQSLQDGLGNQRIAGLNHHGDLAWLAPNTGSNPTETITYTPFGEIYKQWGSDPDPELGFQSQYTDPVSGDVLMQARWYAPGTGTFRNRDTWSGDLNTPVTLNRFTYANNNSIRYDDPTGHCVNPDSCLRVADRGGNAEFEYRRGKTHKRIEPETVGAPAESVIYGPKEATSVGSASDETYFVVIENFNGDGSVAKNVVKATYEQLTSPGSSHDPLTFAANAAVQVHVDDVGRRSFGTSAFWQFSGGVLRGFTAPLRPSTYVNLYYAGSAVAGCVAQQGCDGAKQVGSGVWQGIKDVARGDPGALGELTGGLGLGFLGRTAAAAGRVDNVAPSPLSVLDEASIAAFRAADNLADFNIPLKHQPWAGGGFNKFADGVDQTGVLREALRSDAARFVPNNRPDSFRLIYDMGTAIGTRGETAVRIVVGTDGQIWTAFPVKR